MKCTHLVATRYVSACSAGGKPYVPSIFELGEYCRTNSHGKCPLYLGAVKAFAGLQTAGKCAQH